MPSSIDKVEQPVFPRWGDFLNLIKRLRYEVFFYRIYLSIQKIAAKKGLLQTRTVLKCSLDTDMACGL